MIASVNRPPWSKPTYADLLIALTDQEHDWPTFARDPDLRVLNKIDLFPSPPGTGAGGEGLISVSALEETGLSQLVTTVRDQLIPPADLTHTGPWLFDDRLIKLV